MDIREKERVSEGTEISFKLSLMKMKAGQEYMRLYPEKQYHCYSRISSKLSKCGVRLAVKELLGHFRVETSFPNSRSNF